MQQLRVYYDNGGEDYGCNSSGGNCLPDVVITPTSIHNELLNQIQEIRNIYQQDVEFANALIGEIIASNEPTFQDIFPQSVINEILNNALKLYIRGTESYRCILLYNSNNDIVNVYPVISENQTLNVQGITALYVF